MFVHQYMNPTVVTATPNMTLPDALQMMQECHIRRLPVLDKDHQLVGIVSERDILHSSPSPATSLSVWELNYLWAKLHVKEIMTSPVTTIAKDAKVEEAAHLMIEHKIGGLPVVDENEEEVVGIITETDLFHALMNVHRSRPEMDLFLLGEIPMTMP